MRTEHAIPRWGKAWDSIVKDHGEMATTREFTVSGMTCAHCERAVQAEVSKIGGVTDVEVDAGSGTLSISAETPIDDAEVVAAVLEAGYAVAEQ